MTSLRLGAPARLAVKVAGRVHEGFSQEWYDDDWRRRAGCGPTTATYLLAYCLGRRGLWPLITTPGEAAVYMNRLWEYVTPSYGGLYKTRWMADGLRRYLAAEGIDGYAVEMRAVSILPSHRPPAEDVIAFIRAGLTADSPVAFLNRHAGHESGLDTWHWVPIIELTECDGAVTAVCADEGRRKSFDPAAWTRDTLLGGGLVYLRPTGER